MIETDPQNEREVPPMSFEAETRQVLGSLRSALTGLIGAVPSEVRRPVDLQRALGIDGTIGWGIFRTATAPDPLASAPYVPSSARLKKFIAAAREAGLPPHLIQETESAAIAFDKLVERHAGDREVFDSLVSDYTGDSTETIDLRHKKMAYEATSHLFGLQCDMLLSTTILAPARDPGYLDSATIIGNIGLRRMRKWATYRTNITRYETMRSRPSTSITWEPLSSTDTRFPGLMPAFGSQPPPPVRLIDAENMTGLEVDIPDVGLTGSTTFYVSYVTRNGGEMDPHWSHEAGSCYTMRTSIRRPAQWTVYDAIIHRDVFPSGNGTLRVYRDEPRLVNGLWQQTGQELGLREQLNDLGHGIDGLRLVEVPNYPDILRYSFEQLGWNPREFRVFRCRIQYPVTGSMLLLEFRP